MSEPGTTSDAGDRISMRSLSHGAAWYFAASAAPQFLTLIQSLVVARILGPEEQGVQSFIVFVAVTSSLTLSLGLPLSLQRVVSDALGRGATADVAYSLRCGHVVGIIPAIVAAVVTLAMGEIFFTSYTQAWILAAVYAFFGSLHSVSAQALTGLRQYRDASIVGLSLQMIAVPVIIILLLTGHGVTAMIAVVAAVSAVSAALTLFLLRRTVRRQGLHGTSSAAERRVVRRGLLSFALGGGVLVILDTVVNQRSELAFLALFHGDAPEQIAYFSVAFAAMQTVYRVLQAVIGIVLPTVTALIAAGRMEAVHRGYLQAQSLLLTVSSVGAGGVLACGAPLVTLLWGEEYRPAGQALLMMAVFPVMLGALGAVANSTMLGGGKLRVVIVVQLCGACTTLLLDFVLIRPFGLYGAAAANGIGMLVSVVLLVAAARTTMGLSSPSAADIVRHMVLVLAVAAPGLVVHFFFLADDPAWRLAVGAGGWFILLLLLFPVLRPLLLTEIGSLDGLLRRLPRPVRGWIVAGSRRRPARRATVFGMASSADQTGTPSSRGPSESG